MWYNEDKEDRESGVVIRITGKLDDGRVWYKEFHCYGNKNIEEVCNDCMLRFQCFSGRETIEISADELNIKHMNNVEANAIADLIVPNIKVAIREDKDGNKKAQMNFKKVRKFA